MAITDWLDDIAALFEVSDGRGSQVKSFRPFVKAEFPETVLPSVPCVLTYSTSVVSKYSAGGPCIDLWQGVSEFHLTNSVDKTQYPYIMQFFARIRDAAASHIQLNGKVAFFQLRQEQPSIVGPVVMQYGSEAPHLGLMAYWEVKEAVDGDFTVGA